jgi:putative redox protein
MVSIEIVYEGGLRTRAVHGPSGSVVATDAPRDNEGRGESFSPTDLLATALGTCMLTIMGIVARRHGLAIEGARAQVRKHMVADPSRRVGRLEVEITVPAGIGEADLRLLEAAARSCPVHRSLRDDLEIPLRIAVAGSS